MMNQFANPEYADVIKRMRGELDASRKQYLVPENVKQDLTNIDRKYHSEEIRRRGIERRKAMEAKAAGKKN